MQCRSILCWLRFRLFNLLDFENFSEHKPHNRRAFYNNHLQILTPCSFSNQTTSEHYKQNHHNKGKASLRQQTRGYYSCGKSYCTFAPCSTTVHCINSSSKAYSYFYITQQIKICYNWIYPLYCGIIPMRWRKWLNDWHQTQESQAASGARWW